MKRIVSVLVCAAILITSVLMFNVSSVDYKLGDINGDGIINSLDANVLSRYISGKGVISDTRTADLNGDGKVSALDSSTLKRVIAGVLELVQPSDGNVISVDMYSIVYPENATVYEIYAAEILADWIYDNYKIEIVPTPDTAEETEYEFLVGATNREESATDVTFEANQYLLKSVENKIVLQGKDYMIGGAVGDLTYYKMEDGAVLIDEIATTDAVMDYAPVEGDSVILMIGDGMGFNHIAFTKFYNRKKPDFKGFIAESFPNSGECITYCLSEISTDYYFSKITTDSAAAATALSTGWKTQKGYLGLDGFGLVQKNIREIAHELGFKTAVVSTEGTTGATPSGFTVHTNSRANNDDIIAQQAALVENGEITYLKGESHDNLLEDTKTALDLVSTDSDGYFVMIEEAYIDKASHKLSSDYTIADLAGYVIRFDTAIQYAATFTASRPDSVLIVTADHETGSLTVTGGYDAGGNHSNVNVPVFAMGYGTEYFNGTVVDNTDIADFMARIFGVLNFGGEYTNIR